MLVFIDEAGDTGRKIEKGSSRFFVISLVLFDEYEEANACDQRISLLRRELKLHESYEFHFTENSERIRIEFLKAIQPYCSKRDMGSNMAQIKIPLLTLKGTHLINRTI